MKNCFRSLLVCCLFIRQIMGFVLLNNGFCCSKRRLIYCQDTSDILVLQKDFCYTIPTSSDVKFEMEIFVS